MGDSEQDQVKSWLHDENHIILVTVSSIALAIASLIVWRTKHNLLPDQDRRRDRDGQHSFLASALHIVSLAPGEYDMTRSLASKAVSEDPLPSGVPADQKDPKGPRSKERRRRGKDPYKELLKGGKKTKALLKVAKPGGYEGDSADSHRSVSPFTEMDSKSSASYNETIPSTSRSPSPAARHSQTVDSLRIDTPTAPCIGMSSSNAQSEDHLSSVSTPGLLVPSTSAPSCIVLENVPPEPTELLRSSRSEVSYTHDGGTATSRSSEVIPGPSASSSTSKGSQTDRTVREVTMPTTQTCPADSCTDPSSHSNVYTSATNLQSSQSMPPQIPGYTSSSPSLSASDSRRASTSTVTQAHATWDWEGQAQIHGDPTVYHKPPRFRSKPRIPENGGCSGSGSPMSASMSYNVPFTTVSGPSFPSSSASAPSARVPSSSSATLSAKDDLPPVFTFPTLNPLPPPSTSHPSPSVDGKHNASRANGRGASKNNPTPTPSRGHTPPPSVSAQTQLASMRGALEAARLREEKVRQDAERYAKECEELRWRWGEDTAAWRRKEAELQAQVHHLMQQLQTYAALLASLPQSSPFPNLASPQSYGPGPFAPSPTASPSPRSPSLNPAHAPAHVQQILGSTPMLASMYPHHGQNPFLAFPHPNPHLNPLFFRTDGSGSSTGSVSPIHDIPRGRQRTRQNGAGGEWTDGSAGEGDEECDEDEDDVFSNNILADAILKRPESIRVRVPRKTPSRTSTRSDTSASASTGTQFGFGPGAGSRGSSVTEEAEVGVLREEKPELEKELAVVSDEQADRSADELDTPTPNGTSSEDTTPVNDNVDSSRSTE
ncbi:hypothetical protein BV22DRAFT_1194281 [Leucogyrophana mollusca]|uniref:Uncharacterized protein n=1 Tax=Leucogyrophana mollusca TaxID=85980 RepID=A0ACB8BP14_9AGAM|nr:hypothetical protein BV22DRAFT_1194281 [Leucogyrophana mollusca]